MARPLSIYRGYCTGSGLGELPGDASGRGEQYVAADSELWKVPGLADEARKWMTLYDDQSVAIADNIEGWSYFGYRDLRFVVKLIPSGEFGTRLAYFSHARAWRIGDFQGSDDPGALLGRSDAFHPAWREGQPIRPVPDVRPAMVWREAVHAQPWVAIRLLAQLYRACVTHRPVVMGQPFHAFLSGSRLHQLVAFARAALPADIKRDCRIRVYTGYPEAYLGELKADLVIIPMELLNKVRAARPDVTLLDTDAKAKSGSEADVRYAREVVDRVVALQEFPDSLFTFTRRVAFPRDRIPSEVEAASVPVIYNLVAVAGNRVSMDKLLEHEVKEAAQRKTVLNWNQLITEEEWRHFSQGALAKAALTLATSDDLRTLRQRVREELAKKNAQLDMEALEWTRALSQEIRPAEILKLAQDKLVSRSGLVSLLRQISGDEICALLTDRYNVQQVTSILCDADIPEEWTEALARDSAPLAAILRLAKKGPAWRKIVYLNVSNRVTSAEADPAWLPDLLTLGPPNPLPNLEQYLDFAELLERMDSDEGRREIVNLQNFIQTSEERRRLCQILSRSRWPVLSKYFTIPSSWDPDVADLLLGSRDQLARIDTDRLLKLVGSGKPFSGDLLSALDQKMERHLDATTGSLVRARRWLEWRSFRRNALPSFSYRDCARIWLRIRPNDPSLEEWKRVMSDLGQLSLEMLQDLHRRFPDTNRPWPQVQLFEDEQLADMAELCPDLGVVAELAELMGSNIPAYGAVLISSRFVRKVSEQALRCLNGRYATQTPVPLDEAQYLFENAGSRRQDALVVLSQSVIMNMINSTEEAERVATRTQLWDEPSFHKLAVDWLRHKFDRNQPSQWKVPEVLNRYVTESWSPVGKADSVLEAVAEACLERGLSRLADFLQPDFYVKLVRALLHGESANPVWQTFVVEVKKFNNSQVDQHPLRILTKKIQSLPLEQQQGIAERGWTTFKQACLLIPESICFFAVCQNTLPIIHLAAGMRQDVSLGKVAKGVLYVTNAHNHFEPAAWWAAFFESVKICHRRSAWQKQGERSELVLAVLSDALSDFDLPLGRRDGITELGKYMLAVLSETELQGNMKGAKRPGA